MEGSSSSGGGGGDKMIGLAVYTRTHSRTYTWPSETSQARPRDRGSPILLNVVAALAAVSRGTQQPTRLAVCTAGTGQPAKPGFSVGPQRDLGPLSWTA